MTEQLFLEITAWQKETFPAATALSKLHHLTQEIGELKDELMADGLMEQPIFDKAMEYADCFLLLFGSAASDGMTYQDICDAIRKKMDINRARTWGTPDADGVVNHVKETPKRNLPEGRIQDGRRQ